MIPDKSIVNLKPHVEAIQKALKNDEGYYHGWQSNIAMAFFDKIREHTEPGSGDARKFKEGHTLQSTCNDAAKAFLDMLIAQ